MTKLQAHRGVSSSCPENTMTAFRAAVTEGYDIIECDPKYTADGEIVILHDKTLDRTARYADGCRLPAGMQIGEITLAEAKSYDFGLWFSPDFVGENIPTLCELLDFAAKTKIPIKIDNVFEKFPPDMQERLFAEIADFGERIKIGFTCADPANLALVAARFPHATLHYDGGDLSEARLAEVAKIAQGHELYIWVCYDNSMTKWFKGTKATPSLCSRVKKYGKLGIWILKERAEALAAIRELGADIIETTGHIKPKDLSF